MTVVKLKYKQTGYIILSFKISFFLLILSLVFAGCSIKTIHPDFFKNIELNQSKTFEASIMAMASNEQRKLIAIGYENGQVDVFEGNSGSKYMSFTPTVLNIRSNILNFSHDGRYLTFGAEPDDGTYFYDINTKSFITQLHETRGSETFTSDDKFLFLSDGDALKIYDMVNQKWIETYISEYHIESITLNKNNTQLALCRFNGIIELYSIKRSSWYEKVFQGLIPIKLTLLSKVKIPREEKCYIHDLWLQDNKLITLSSYEKKEREENVTIKTGQTFKTTFYHKEVKLDIWSLPHLQHISSLPLQIDSVRQAKISKNEKNIVILGSKEKCGHYLETIALDTNKTFVITRLRTNISNMAPWPESTEDYNNQVFFIEHNANKILYRSGKPPVYNHSDKFAKSIQEYLDIPYWYKSFAIAEDQNGTFAYGFAHNRSTQEEADISSLAICYEEAQKRNIKSKCHVIFQNDTPITSN
ncbi:MAG: WD40 repeat domain-containing protein [Sulfuricurvum sp.]|nr:WD40 repeat domain-containing protein [Sulfuricurvum sp.]